MNKNRYIYFEFSINAITLGKVFIQLFNDLEVKKATENFISLCCQGQKYYSIYSDNILTYKNCKVEKIKRGKCIKSGYLQNKIDFKKCDIQHINTIKNEETEKYEKVECIYGRCFDKQYSTRKHLSAGLLTVVNIGKGKRKYSSVFKITLGKVKKYDNKNLIIGRVIKNMHILRAIELLPVYKNYEPRLNVYISDCNEIDEKFFKKENISVRGKYINSLFENLKTYKERDEEEDDWDDDEGKKEEEEEEKEEEIESILKSQVWENRKDTQEKKKKKKNSSEKQQGIELLKKVLLLIEQKKKQIGLTSDKNEGTNKEVEKKKVKEKDNEHEEKEQYDEKEKKEEEEDDEEDDEEENDEEDEEEEDDEEEEKEEKEDEDEEEGEEEEDEEEEGEEEEDDDKEEERKEEKKSAQVNVEKEEEETCSYDNSSDKKKKEEIKKKAKDNNKGQAEEPIKEQGKEKQNNLSIYEQNLSKTMSAAERRLLELELRMNEARVLNHKEMLREKEFKSSSKELKSMKDLLEYRREQMETLSKPQPNKTENEGGNDEILGSFIIEETETEKDKNSYLLNTNAIKAYDKARKNKKGNGYILENDLNLYKKIKFDLPFNKTIYEEKKKKFGEENFYGKNMLINETAENTENEKNKVVEFCKKQEILRSKFSRKRREEKELFKNYVNVRNKVYNKKLDRYFNKYTVEIRQNLEKK